MIRVCFAPGKTSISDVEKTYAIMLARYLSGEHAISGYIGCWGGFERQTINANHIHKLHIKTPEETPWNKNIKQPNRKSDGFLIYASHYMFRDYYLFIGIIHPDAHKRINQLLPGIISFSESNFQNRNERELRDLLCVS